jgi:hypothetical protein
MELMFPIHTRLSGSFEHSTSRRHRQHKHGLTIVVKGVTKIVETYRTDMQFINVQLPEVEIVTLEKVHRFLVRFVRIHEFRVVPRTIQQISKHSFHLNFEAFCLRRPRLRVEVQTATTTQTHFEFRQFTLWIRHSQSL